MGVTKQQRAIRTMRGPIWSPGGRDRARSAPQSSGDRPPLGSFAVDGLTGAAMQRSDPQFHSGIPGNDCTVARRTASSRSKVSKLAANDALRVYVPRSAGRDDH